MVFKNKKKYINSAIECRLILENLIMNSQTVNFNNIAPAKKRTFFSTVKKIKQEFQTVDMLSNMICFSTLVIAKTNYRIRVCCTLIGT